MTVNEAFVSPLRCLMTSPRRNLENVNPLILDQSLTIDGKEQPITSNTDSFSRRNVKRRNVKRRMTVFVY